MVRNKRFVAFFAIVVAAVALGYRWGAGDVKNDWDGEKFKQLVAERDVQEEWRKRSAQYQRTIAEQAKRVSANKSAVQSEISRSYGTCVANHDIVKLWNGSFGNDSAAR